MSRMPGIEGRYIRRARGIRDTKAFRESLETEIGTWNTAHPRFAVSAAQRATIRQSLPLHFLPGACLYPPLINAAIDQWNLNQQLGKDDVDWEFELAQHEWGEMVLRLCTRWWTPMDWPALGRGLHPVASFVSACLVSNPQFIEPETWIRIHVEFIAFMDHPYSGTDTFLELALLRWLEDFRARLIDIAGSDDTISQETIDRVFNETQQPAFIEASKQKASIPDSREPFLWLYPGMNRSDWRALEERAISVANDTGTLHIPRHPQRSLATRIVMMADEGLSHSEIARQLGLDQRTVTQYLNDPH